MSTTPSRLAPCPCGSGRRYKECHGAIAVTGSTLAMFMQQALTFQQAGQLAEAISRYEQALKIDPDNFDALHMLGVSWFQANELDHAEHFVTRAMQLAPDLGNVESNLRLILEARKIQAAEEHLCREVLPRIARLCRPALPNAAGPLELVVATRSLDPAECGMLRRLLDPPYEADLWAVPATRLAAEQLAVPRIARWDSPKPNGSARVLVFATELPSAAWLAPPPCAVTLIVNRAIACPVIDRVRELSYEGRQAIELAHTPGAELSGIPSTPFDTAFPLPFEVAAR